MRSPAISRADFAGYSIAERAKRSRDGPRQRRMRNVADRRLELVAGNSVRHAPEILKLGKLTAQRQKLPEGFQEPPAHRPHVELGAGHGFDGGDELGARHRVAGKSE